MQPEPEVQDATEALVAREPMAISRTELDVLVQLASRNKRSVTRFMRDLESMATVTEEVAEGCIYSLPREDRKTGETNWIQGPSVRLAEMVANAWGNCRVGARIVESSGDYVVAQGVFHDLERNVQISVENRRSIINRYGRRFSEDMVNMTANATSAVALRNAVMRGVPRAFWESAYQAAHRVVAGDAETLGTRRLKMLDRFAKIGVTLEKILARMGLRGIEDITLDTMVTLRTLFTAIRDGDTTVDQAFPEVPKDQPGTTTSTAASVGMDGLRVVLADKPATQVSTPEAVSIAADTAQAPPPLPEPAAEPVQGQNPTTEPDQAGGVPQAAAEEVRPMCSAFPCTNESEVGSTYCATHLAEPSPPVKPSRGRKGQG